MSGVRTLGDYDIIAWLDGEATPERRQEIERVLTQDSAASDLLDAWRKNDEILRAAFARIPAEPLPATLLLTQRSGSRADADEPIRAPIRLVRRVARIRRDQRGRLLGLTALSFAAGALLTLFAAGLTEHAPSLLAGPERYLFPKTAGHEAGKRLTQRALDAFRTFGDDSLRPVEVSAPSEIASWLSRQVEAPVRAPNLKAEGLRLLGGRLTPGDGGPAALILFQTARGARVGLYIGRSSTQINRFQYSESRMSGAVWWMTGGESYAVVGPADRAWLTKIARAARQQDANPLRLTLRSNRPLDAAQKHAR